MFTSILQSNAIRAAAARDTDKLENFISRRKLWNQTIVRVLRLSAGGWHCAQTKTCPRYSLDTSVLVHIRSQVRLAAVFQSQWRKAKAASHSNVLIPRFIRLPLSGGRKPSPGLDEMRWSHIKISTSFDGSTVVLGHHHHPTASRKLSAATITAIMSAPGPQRAASVDQAEHGGCASRYRQYAQASSPNANSSLLIRLLPVFLIALQFGMDSTLWLPTAYQHLAKCTSNGTETSHYLSLAQLLPAAVQLFVSLFVGPLAAMVGSLKWPACFLLLCSVVGNLIYSLAAPGGINNVWAIVGARSFTSLIIASLVALLLDDKSKPAHNAFVPLIGFFTSKDGRWKMPCLILGLMLVSAYLSANVLFLLSELLAQTLAHRHHPCLWNPGDRLCAFALGEHRPVVACANSFLDHMQKSNAASGSDAAEKGKLEDQAGAKLHAETVLTQASQVISLIAVFLITMSLSFKAGSAATAVVFAIACSLAMMGYNIQAASLPSLFSQSLPADVRASLVPWYAATVAAGKLAAPPVTENDWQLEWSRMGGFPERASRLGTGCDRCTPPWRSKRLVGVCCTQSAK
ncbi:hypothetical protein L1887_54898 [Cichorium endivia]|nr:hypothetical protein L1887_54898 [Cichorium endivia]